MTSVTGIFTSLPQLDFIHLNINKKQGKLKQKLCQEVADAYPANGIYHDPGNLCEAVLETHLGTCADSVVGCHSLSSRANGDRCVAGDGIELGKAFSELSSCSQSCSLVEPGSESHFVRIIGQCLCREWSSDPG